MSEESTKNGESQQNEDNIDAPECEKNSQLVTYYKMNHAKRGLAVIFNHEFFKSSKLDPRTGTTVDYENLFDELKNLGFEVKIFHNLTYAAIKKNLARIAEMDHSNHDCLVIIILSHGHYGTLYAHDEEYKVDILWSSFTSDKCPTLEDKPKLFFIQACQGNKYDSGTLLKDRTETDDGKEEDHEFRIISDPDFLIVCSTIPGFYSWRNQENGSWFIQALCHGLRENGTLHDILTLLTFVSQQVALDFESYVITEKEKHQKKQMPCITSTLTRLVKFAPIQNT